MTPGEIFTKVKAALMLCAGWESDEYAIDRTTALNYYFQRKRGDEVVGRSQLVSGDVSSMVEASLSQMLEAFSSGNIVEFNPNGEEDEDQAQLESDAVLYFVDPAGEGYVHLAWAIKDTLLLRNGVMKAWVDERQRSKTRTFDNVAPEALPQLTAETPDLKVKVLSYDPDEKTFRARYTQTTRKFRAESVPIENFLYLKDWDSTNVQDCPVVAERHLDIRSDLIERFPKAKAAIERLPAYHTDYKSDSIARNPHTLMPLRRPIDASGDLIQWYEVYALFDSDGDGIAERHRVSLVSDARASGPPVLNENAVLEDVEVPLVPYAVGQVILAPHRLTGISLYDKLRSTQDERTALKRARGDNINTTTKNRLAYLDGKVNVDDVSDGRPNGSIRVKANVGDVRAAVMPFAVPDTSGPISSAIQETKNERTELGGAALELATGQMQIGGDRMGSQGLDRAYSVVEQLCAMMTKNVAATLIRDLFLLAHATLRENFNTPVPVKRNGKWASPVPAQWQPRTRVTVKIGMSAGERARRVASLDKILNNQVQLAQLGMDEVLVNLDGFYRVMMDRDRAADIQNPEQYYVDPQSDDAQKALKSKAAAAQQQKQMQQQLVTQAVQLEQLRVALDKYAGDADRQFKYWNAVLGSEVEEAKIVGAATTDLLTAREVPNEDRDHGSAKGRSEVAAQEPAAATDS